MDQKRRRRVAILLAACVTLTPLLTLARSATAAEGDPIPLDPWNLTWELNKTHPFEELSRRFDSNEDGYVDIGMRGHLPGVLNPAQFTLHVNACDAPEGFTSVDFQLARPNEDPLPAVNVSACETDLVLPDKPYPEAREYVLTATAHYADGDQTVRRDVRVQDVFMIGLGDSYASGEGNPAHVAEFGNVVEEFDNIRCHRSRAAGQEQAAYMLDAKPGITVTFLHLACSGAEALEGLLQPYAGLKPRNPTDPPLPPQLSQAAEYIELSKGDGPSKRFPDVVVTSIGGNDAGFADIVKSCLTYPAWVPIPIPVFPYVVPFDLDSCYEQGEPGDVLLEAGLAALPGLYEEIDKAVDGEEGAVATLCDPTDPCKFMITEYPDGSTDENGDPCDYYPLGFSDDEFEWVIDTMATRLNEKILESAAAEGWVYVGNVRSNFDRHGICAEDDWLRDIAESFAIQGDENGAFHPDWAGHLYGYAPAIANRVSYELGFGSRTPNYSPPMYGGTGQPDVCDTTVGDGAKETFTAAPSTDPTGLNLPAEIASRLASGTLPSGEAAANTCGAQTNVAVPLGQPPVDMRAGFAGCPDDPRPCQGSSAGSAWLRFPTWTTEEVPTIEVSASADVERGAGDPGTIRHRTGNAIARGTTVFLAAANGGSPTVSGEIVVDLTARAQSNGASATGNAAFTLSADSIVNEESCDGDYCLPHTETEIGGVQLDLTRFTCQEEAEFDHGCYSTYGTDSYRRNTTVLQAWTGSHDTMLIDVDESHDGSYIAAAGSSVPVRTGLASPRGQIRIPYTVPAGSVVSITLSAETYTTANELCTIDINDFTCAAQARSSALVSFVPDVASGILMPLSGFQPPVVDSTAPTVTATPSGPAGSNGWYVGETNVALHAVDEEGGSGVHSLSYSIDGGAPIVVDGATATAPLAADGNHTVTYTGTDVAGNTSETGSSTVKVDATPPSITISPLDDAEYATGASVPTDLACSDATSGVASCEGPATLDTSAAGQHTATFTATDNAGNVTTQTVNYTVTAPPPPPPPATDGLSVSIPELGFALEGNLTSGGFTITRNASGQPTAVIGTGTLAGPGAGTTTVSILAVRAGNMWVGAITVSNAASGVNATGTTLSRNGVTAVGTDGATGTFTSRRPVRTITWTVTDRV